MKKITAHISPHYTLALVGRVNVGKSTLFNMLVGGKKALSSPLPGTTRDVRCEKGDWRGLSYTLCDTGGFFLRPSSDIDKKIAQQAENSISKADCIIFCVDHASGYHPDDKTYLSRIRKLTKKPILLALNKVDRRADYFTEAHSEWLKLGLGSPVLLSAQSGTGTGDLFDKIHFLFSPKDELEVKEKKRISLAFVGRPNVGKSSLLNAIFGEERMIVSPLPHTTREPQHVLVEYGDHEYVLIDTVGMRKKNAIKFALEKEGIFQSIESLKKADVVVLVLESMVTPSKQESRILEIAVEAGAGILVLVNKWDLLEKKETKTPQAFETFFRTYFPFIPWAPMLFVSALQKQRIPQILEAVLTIQTQREHMLEKKDSDTFIAKAISKQPPQWIRFKKKPIIYGFAQKKVCPPTFALLVKDSTSIDYSYLRYLENRLREVHGFKGTPIRIHTEQIVKKQ